MSITLQTVNRNHRDIGAEKLFGMNGTLRDYIDYGYSRKDSFQRTNTNRQNKKKNGFVAFLKQYKDTILAIAGVATATIFAFNTVKFSKNLFSKISTFLKN